MSITIKTHLHEGIYKSSGGGETRTHYEWTTGPRNLLKAVNTLHEHRADMVRGYGNIGCGGSWLEIDGVVIDRFDIDNISNDDFADLPAEERRYGSSWARTRTQKALDLLAEIKAGTYTASRKVAADDYDAYLKDLYPLGDE